MAAYRRQHLHTEHLAYSTAPIPNDLDSIKQILQSEKVGKIAGNKDGAKAEARL